MPKWEMAMNKFLDGWREKPEVLGAVLYGSMATGNDNELSDIDLHIILKSDVPWRDRGLTKVLGITLEWYAVPIGNFKIYADAELNKEQTKAGANQFATGKIIFDKDGSVAKLVEENKEWHKRAFPAMTSEAKALAQKHLWGYMDCLEEYDKYPSPMFSIIYAILINEIIDFQARMAGVERMPLERAHKILTGENYRIKYGFPKIAEDKYAKLLLTAIEKQSFENIKVLYDYIQELSGGFDPTNWYLRRNSLTSQ